MAPPYQSYVPYPVKDERKEERYHSGYTNPKKETPDLREKKVQNQKAITSFFTPSHGK